MFHELQIFENPEAILLVASIIFFFSIIAGKAGSAAMVWAFNSVIPGRHSL